MGISSGVGYVEPAAAQGVTARIIVGDLEFPTAIAFASDGTMYVNERPGRVRVVRNGRLDPEPLAEIPTTTAGETGLLGAAVAPDDRSLFVFATDPGGGSNRVLRVPLGGGTPDIVVDGLPASVYHNGGGVAFDDGGSLLVSNGEIHDSSNSQDSDERGGKIYRFTPDGAPVAGNPFGESIALGLRNPFGLTIDPVSGNAFVTENGPSSHDEINRIVVGGNYGWPEVSGPAGGDVGGLTGTYVDPLLDYPEIIVPTGIAIADPENARREVAGDLFFGSYGEATIHRVRLSPDRTRAVSDEVFVTEDEPVVAVAWGPRGLYYATTSAVKLIPLAVEEEPSPSPRTTEAESRSPTSAGPHAEGREDGGSAVAIVLAVAAGVAAAVAVGAIAFARRGRPE